jgi:hypothetical protein
MGVTLFLKQKGVFAILTRGRAVSLQVREVEGGRMGTSCEAHQVGGRQKYSAIDEPHLNSSLLNPTPRQHSHTSEINFQKGLPLITSPATSTVLNKQW